MYGEVRLREYTSISLGRPLTCVIQAFILSFFLGRYPDYLRPAMWFGLALYFASLFCSSFATQVRLL